MRPDDTFWFDLDAWKCHNIQVGDRNVAVIHVCKRKLVIIHTTFAENAWPGVTFSLRNKSALAAYKAHAFEASDW